MMSIRRLRFNRPIFISGIGLHIEASPLSTRSILYIVLTQGWHDVPLFFMLTNAANHNTPPFAHNCVLSVLMHG
jgi:hypothetical protein